MIDLDGYCRRIGYYGPRDGMLETLRELHRLPQFKMCGEWVRQLRLDLLDGLDSAIARLSGGPARDAAETAGTEVLA